MITQNVNVSADKRSLIPIVHMVQGDSGRRLTCVFQDYDIPSGSSATLSFERPDGNVYTTSATISNNNVSASITQTMLNVVGHAKATFHVTSSSSVVSNFAVDVEVEESAGFAVSPSSDDQNIYVIINGTEVRVPTEEDLDDLEGRVSESIADILDDVYVGYHTVSPDWANKAVSASTGEQSNDRLNRCSNTTLIYLPKNGSMSVGLKASNINVEVYKFDENKTFIGYDVLTTDASYNGASYFRVLINYKDNSNINVSDADALVAITIKANAISDMLDLTTTNNLLYGLSTTLGYYNSSKHHDSTTYHYFSMIPVISGKTYNIEPRARFFTVVNNSGSVIQAVSNDNIRSVPVTESGYAYVSFYTADDIALYKMYDAEDGDCPPYYKKYLSDKIELNVKKGSTDVLYGKKWAALGDSFTHGAFSGASGDTTFSDEPYKNELMVYPFFIGRRVGMNVVNMAVSGMTMAQHTERPSTHSFVPYLYQDVPTDADYITLKFGINDENYSTPIGDIDDTDITTFYGAWNTCLAYYLEHNPNAKIGIIVTNGIDSNDYIDAIIAVAQKWGIPYLDEVYDYKVPLLHRVQRPNVSAAVKQQKLELFRVSASNTHPNVFAHEYESTFVENWLRSL